ncbi:MAG TPA: PQQ-binding-like beta-propeller repeat protein, partial [Polyangia bacterium]
MVVGCKARYQPLVTVSGAITATADDLRTGFYPNQPKLAPAIVGGATFGRLWKTNLPLSTGEQVFAQPLFTGGAVFVATLANNIYSLDGDTGAVRASRALGTPWRTSDIGCGDVTPTVGIAGTPVIDDAANVAYFLSKTYLGDAPVSDTTNSAWFLHAVDVLTLAEQTNFPVRIQGVADNDQAVRFDPFYQMQRTGLLLMNGVVYAGFGSHCDYGQYEGWVIGVGTDGVIKSLFATETGPGAGRGAGIWQAGGGLVSDGPGRIFFTTGNHIGAPNMTPAAQPTAVLGQSVVRLDVRNDATLVASDYFSPADRQMLDAADVDLGSGAPVALPAVPFSTTAAPNLMIAG